MVGSWGKRGDEWGGWREQRDTRMVKSTRQFSIQTGIVRLVYANKTTE